MAGAITLANLIVRMQADSATLLGDFRKVGTASVSMGKRIATTEVPLRSMATGMLAIGATAGGIGFAAKKVFDVGAAVEETASKYRTVLGPALDETNAFLDEFATKAGLSRQAAQDSIATTAAMAQGFGLATDASVEMAQQVLRAGADLASFNNVQGGAAEGAQIIATALAGERERLKQLGIVIMEADVQHRALAMSGKALASELTQAEKATASMALIVEKAGVQMGDLDRTQNSAANTARRVGARFANMRDEIATNLMPVLGALVGGLDENASAMDAVTSAVRTGARWLRELIAGVQILGARAPLAIQRAKIAFLKLKDALPFVELSEQIREAERHLGFMEDAVDDITREIVRDFDAADAAIAALGPEMTATSSTVARGMKTMATRSAQELAVLRGAVSHAAAEMNDDLRGTAIVLKMDVTPEFTAFEVEATRVSEDSARVVKERMGEIRRSLEEVDSTMEDLAGPLDDLGSAFDEFGIDLGPGSKILSGLKDVVENFGLLKEAIKAIDALRDLNSWRIFFNNMADIIRRFWDAISWIVDKLIGFFFEIRQSQFSPGPGPEGFSGFPQPRQSLGPTPAAAGVGGGVTVRIGGISIDARGTTDPAAAGREAADEFVRRVDEALGRRYRSTLRYEGDMSL